MLFHFSEGYFKNEMNTLSLIIFQSNEIYISNIINNQQASSEKQKF